MTDIELPHTLTTLQDTRGEERGEERAIFTWLFKKKKKKKKREKEEEEGDSGKLELTMKVKRTSTLTENSRELCRGDEQY